MNKMIVVGNNRLMFFDLSRRTDFSRVRILASRPTTSNPGGSMIFCRDLLPYPKDIVLRRQQLDFDPIPKHIENWVCWQSLCGGRLFWHLLVYAYWHQHASPELYQPFVPLLVAFKTSRRYCGLILLPQTTGGKTENSRG
jgi:hypothetical protein